MFITADDVSVPASNLNDELNVPLYVLQGHFNEKISEDVWDMANRTPAEAMEFRINWGLGGLGDNESRVAAVKARALRQSGEMQRLLLIGMSIQAKRITQRQKALAAALGLNGPGMGHIMGKAEAIVTGEGPWYNPGGNHNAWHQDGTWADITKYPASDIVLMERTQKMSRYELEHMDVSIFTRLLAKTKEGIQVLPDSKPLDPPLVAAKEALNESFGGKIVFGGLFGLKKWLPWIGAGIVALYLAPQIIKTVKAARK